MLENFDTISSAIDYKIDHIGRGDPFGAKLGVKTRGTRV